MDTVTFGVPVAGVTYEQRRAAYAVIRNSVGAVAAVHVPAGYWLPGGGMLPGETPEETVVREVREELGCPLHLVCKIGEAVQYFFAAAEGRYYAMQVVFFRAELVEGPRGSAEYEPCWLNVSPPVRGSSMRATTGPCVRAEAGGGWHVQSQSRTRMWRVTHLAPVPNTTHT